jgi:hypothetical protein
MSRLSFVCLQDFGMYIRNVELPHEAVDILLVLSIESPYEGTITLLTIMKSNYLDFVQIKSRLRFAV